MEGLPVLGVVGSSSFVEAVETCLRRGMGGNEYEFGVVFLEFGYFVQAADSVDEDSWVVCCCDFG